MKVKLRIKDIKEEIGEIRWYTNSLLIQIHINTHEAERRNPKKRNPNIHFHIEINGLVFIVLYFDGISKRSFKTLMVCRVES